MPSEKQIDYIAEAIKDSFGDRCHEHSDGCPTCEVWKQYDDLCTVPDVPELVRYDPNNKAYPYFEMEESELGEYVRYDQAAEIIRFMIPRVNNCGRYIAERNDGALMYLNHGNTWQGCDNFIAAKDAENERLKEVLRKAHACFENDKTGKFKDIQNEINKVLSGKEPK